MECPQRILVDDSGNIIWMVCRLKEIKEDADEKFIPIYEIEYTFHDYETAKDEI